MAYIAGDVITADQYNIFVGNSSSPYGVNHIYGTGSGEYGLGQSEISTVATSNTITAAQWNSLFTQMDSIASHTGDSGDLTATTAVSTGDSIAIKAALESDIATLAASVAAGCPNTTATSSGSVDQALSSSSNYDKSHVTEVSFTFAGGDEARWFFNAGGQLKVALSNTATNSTAKDTVLSALMSQMGNFTMGAHSSDISGTPVDSTMSYDKGYYDLGTSYINLFEIAETTSTYSASYNQKIFIRIEGKTGGAHADGRGNTGDVVTLKVTTSVDDGNYTNYDATNIAAGPNNWTNSYVPVNIREAGPTTHSFSTVDLTSGGGLSTLYNSITVAKVSNSRIDNEDGTVSL